MKVYPLSISITIISNNLPHKYPIKIHYDYSTFDADEDVS